MIASGIANIGDTTGNIIGSQSVPGSINVNSTATGDSDVFGIAFFAAANVTISNNSVGGIAATNSNLAPGAIDLYGIRADTNGSSTNTIQNNIIGASAAPVNNNAASASSNTYGIYSLTGTPALSNNTVSNLTMAAGNVGTDTSASMIGISVDASSASGSALVSENVIRNLNNSSAAAAVVVTGMVYSGGVGGPDIVERNFIHSIGNASSNASAQISGIIIVGGSSDFRNNMIAIGNSVTTGPIINGIIETGSASDNIYFNSVYIGGINNGPTVANTFAFNSPVITNIRNYRDNIFFNARTNGSGTGRHYAIQLGGSSSNPTGLISNNNILLASGNGGYTGRYNSVDRVTLANWQTATGQDGNSFSASPLFIAASATMPDLHIQPASGSIVESNGFNTGVIDDFDGQTRSTLSPVDIGADAGNFVAVVLNHGTLSFTSTSFSGSEGSSTLNISVQRTGGTDGAVSVPISFSDTTATGGAVCSGGIDFVNTATTISFNDAEGGTKSYSVPVCQDSIYEGNETFSALLGNPTGGASVGGTNPATVTILDDDSAPAIQFSAPTYVEDESQTLQLTVSRSGDTSGTSTVDLDTSGGDAVGGASCTAGVDYITTNISGLAFGPSETSKLVQIPICSDMQSETTETFGITLSNPGGSGATLGSPASATVSINDTASEYRSTDTIAFNGKGPAAPYPSNILVSGAPSAIGSMRVTLYDVQASFADDIDILLVGPQGQTLILMSDAGGSDGLGLPATVTFSDAAAVSLPDSGTTSTGGYRATNWAPDPDSFLGAPAGPYGDPATLTNPFGQTFTGTDPNGTWSLYVINDNESGLASGAADGIVGGWGIEFFGTTAAQGNISGHVMSADGLGIRNATVTVSGRSLHEPLSVKTNGSGKYSVGGLSVATDYVVSVEAKGFSFPTPTVLMRFTGDAKETNFTAEQSKKGR
jgi:Calx-beta domain.